MHTQAATHKHTHAVLHDSFRKERKLQYQDDLYDAGYRINSTAWPIHQLVKRKAQNCWQTSAGRPNAVYSYTTNVRRTHPAGHNKPSWEDSVTCSFPLNRCSTQKAAVKRTTLTYIAKVSGLGLASGSYTD